MFLRKYFNPRTPYGMRPNITCFEVSSAHYFNPRTPYGMRLANTIVFPQPVGNFNPRTPYGMRHCFPKPVAEKVLISIHAPLTGCDSYIVISQYIMLNFNPRTPYGMRRNSLDVCFWEVIFQSTHPLRDATVMEFVVLKSIRFQSTHPLRDATKLKGAHIINYDDFNPRTPYGMRQRGQPYANYSRNFNPRTPYGMRPAGRKQNGGEHIFQSTHPLRDATTKQWITIHYI